MIVLKPECRSRLGVGKFELESAQNMISENLPSEDSNLSQSKLGISRQRFGESNLKTESVKA
jgi:hypothetical protein